MEDLQAYLAARGLTPPYGLITSTDYLIMPRRYSAIDADKPSLLPTIREAGYKEAQFGTISWEETGMPEEPVKRFVQVARAAGKNGATKQYDLDHGDWLPRALLDISSFEFGRP